MGTNYSVGFQYPGWHADGLLGLAFPSISSFGGTPLFHSLVYQHALPVNSFGVYLNQNYSELFIGGTNSALYQGDFTYVSLTEEVCLCRVQ